MRREHRRVSATLAFSALAALLASDARAQSRPDLDVLEVRSDAQTHRAPLVDAGADAAFLPGQAVAFHGAFVDPDARDSWEILWDFGDGSTAAGSLTPTHAYSDCGTFTARLTVTDASGASGTGSLTVQCETSCPLVFEEIFDRYGAGARPPEWVDVRIPSSFGKNRPNETAAFRTALEDGDVIYRSTSSGVSEYRGRDALEWNNYDFTGSLRLAGDRSELGALLAYADVEGGHSYALALARDGGRVHTALLKLEASSAETLAAVETAVAGLARRSNGQEHPRNGRKSAVWYGFRLRVESIPAATLVLARVWPIDEREPDEWHEQLHDRRHPFSAGGIGVAALGDAFAVDDLRVEALAGASSGISGDRDGDGVCDVVDNCPARENPEQVDEDGDGIGDVCDDCVAASRSRPLCLDDGYNRRNGRGEVVASMSGPVKHVKKGGVCGTSGFYQLGPWSSLVVDLPRSTGAHRLRFQVRGRLAAGALRVEVEGKVLAVPSGRHPKEPWSWTDPIVVPLHGKPLRLRLHAASTVAVERLSLEPDCGRLSSPKCLERTEWTLASLGDSGP
jgi:hypothetical protein